MIALAIAVAIGSLVFGDLSSTAVEIGFAVVLVIDAVEKKRKGTK